MNLEERLRGHLNATPEPVRAAGRSAGEIIVAGRRRQTRRKAGTVVAAALVAAGVLGGVLTLLDDGPGQQDFAGQSNELDTRALDSLELDDAASAGTSGATEPTIGAAGEGAVTEGVATDGAEPVSAGGNDLVVGVEDGFAGLRSGEEGLLFITSDDGEDWSETGTSGIGDGQFVVDLDYWEGTFVALFESFDDALVSSSLGVSTNGFDWSLRRLDVDATQDEFVTYGGLSIGPDGVVVVASIEGVDSPRSLVLSGPVEGELAASPLDVSTYFVSSAAVGEGSAALVAFSDDGQLVLRTNDGINWLIAERLNFDQPAAVVVDADGEIVVITSTPDGVSFDGSIVATNDSIGEVWTIEAAAGEAGVAVLVTGIDTLTGAPAHSLWIRMVGEQWRELDIGNFVSPDEAPQLAAVGDDEVLLAVFGFESPTTVRVPIG